MRLLYIFLLFPALGWSQLTDELAESLRLELQEAVELNNIEGVSAAVIFPNGDVWKDAYGLISETDSITTEHHLYSGSTTKTLVSASILQLQEEGQLSIEDSLGMYIGPFDNINGAITLKQLLEHTSGIYNYTDHEDFFNTVFVAPNNLWTTSEILSFVNEPIFSPGDDWSYSNTNYVLLSMIIESVTQGMLADDFQSRFFEPLNMDQTFLGAYQNEIGPYGGMWLDANGNGSLDEFSTWNTTALLSGAWGAGGLSTVPADLAHWAKTLYGTNEVLNAQSFEQLTTGSIHQQAYGLGVVLGSYGGCTMLGHGGGIIHTTEMRYFVEEDFSAVMIINGGQYDFSDYLDIVDKVKEALIMSSSIELTNENSQVYPNPFDHVLHIKLPNASALISIDFYDITGRLLTSFDSNNLNVTNQKISIIGERVAPLFEGKVLYKLTTNEGVQTGLLFKEGF